MLLDVLMLTPALLNSLPKVAVPAAGLRTVLVALAATLPFDEKFYAKTYPDLAEAKKSGAIADLHSHFVNHGFLEGRLAAAPDFDEVFYRQTYPDVAESIARGDVTSAYDHYISAGAAEGRFPNAAAMNSLKS